MIKYNIYPTLLDKYQGYLSSNEIYKEIYGFVEEPTISEEEFEQKQFQSLIDGINRVPFESEKADKGTAFNEVVDCLIENRKSEKMELKSNVPCGTIEAFYKNQLFTFDLKICKEFANYLKGSVCQVYCEAEIKTTWGDVKLYGYIDQVTDFKIIDTKTTSRYKAFKFRKNWQHIVYPFCLSYHGCFINEFEYVVTDFKNCYIECYNFDINKDSKKLKNHIESFIEFIEENKSLITDKKIFNQL